MRKVLSFVLVLSLILGSFSMAFAATPATPSDVTAGAPNFEAIDVGLKIGYITGFPDGTYKATQAVNRAEFAKLMAGAMGIPESALAGYATTTFKDINGYQWAIPYLAFCQSKGIMIGDGNGNVRPGAQISVNEGMTMLMRALGYTENSAALVGTWPAKYITLAKNNDMYDDVANAVMLDRGNAAQVVYNVLTVDKVEVSADGTTKVLSDRTNANTAKWNIVNMLTTGLGCEAITAVISGSEETLINLKPYIGKEVVKFVQKDKPKAIVAIASEESTAVTGKLDVDSTLDRSGSVYTITSGSSLKEDSTDVKYTFTTSVGSVFQNGEEVTTASIPVSSKASITINGDISGKKITNVQSIQIWNTKIDGSAKKVVQSDLNQIKEQRLLGYDFETLKDGSIDFNSFELAGVTSLDKIAVDNVVYVYANKAGDITKVEVGTTTVTGDVTMVKGTKYTVDGKVYEFSTNTKMVVSDRPVAGDNVILYLDANGEIFDVKNNTGANDKYAVVEVATTVRDEVKLYTSADNDAVWFTAKKDAKPALSSVGALIGYTLNSKGEISNATNGAVVNVANATMSAATVINLGGTNYTVKSDAVVFASKGGIIADATTAKNVETSTGLNAVSALLNAKGDVVAMIIDETFTSKTDKDTFGVIDSVGATTDPTSKDKVQQVFGLLGKDKLEKFTDDNATITAGDLGMIGTADPELWKIDVKSDGKIKGITNQVEDLGGAGATVTAIMNNADTFKVNGTTLAGLASDAVVYRAVIKDGVVDAYVLSDKGSIGEGNEVFFYDTDDDKDAAGYEYVIYITRR